MNGSSIGYEDSSGGKLRRLKIRNLGLESLLRLKLIEDFLFVPDAA